MFQKPLTFFLNIRKRKPKLSAVFSMISGRIDCQANNPLFIWSSEDFDWSCINYIFLTSPNEKKCSGVKSGERRHQAAGPLRIIQLV